MQIRWSPTALKNAANCSLALFYDKVMKLRPTHSGMLAGGDFIHGFIERFYNEDQTPRYKSAESFANAAFGGWFNYMQVREKEGKPVVFKDGSDKYILANKIKNAARTLYERYSKDVPPLFIEYGYKLDYNGRMYSGRIDEIRQGHIVRDHKNKSLEEMKPWTMSMLEAETQPPSYALAYSLSAFNFEWFRERIGLNEEERKELEKDELALVEKVTFEYHFLQSGKIVQLKVNRRRIRDLELLVDESQLKLDNRVVAPNRKSCYFCLYNDKCDDYIDIAQSPGVQGTRQLTFFDPDPRTNLVKEHIIGRVARKKTNIRQFSLRFR